MTTVGLLLAAGAGRRMGGPKALVRPADDAPTLLEATLDRLLHAGLEQVVVVLGASAEQARPLAEVAGAAVVVADDWEEGMGASLRAGLRHLDATAAPEVHAAVVTLVDLPDVGTRVYRRVLSATRGAGPEVLLRATYDGTAGHPVVLGRAHWAAVADTARGDRGARDHLAAHPPTSVECGDLASGTDADTPDALRAHRHAP
ncbi:nucleotidyltransferase family protein [Arthrobacter sp. NEB 688]|uniref:nucleotidyltransferase family protein n=1 Tax=Arthrobacter sp. NEB 688 TaxID=904039 RepID=UPI00156354F2|nr:nucleotidyltransferase family protein [Arthrobacter sp. NEB 688]QKE83780.1 nucleotidyltransferase family protein [Arthrobacter sp. NEB 688]